MSIPAVHQQNDEKHFISIPLVSNELKEELDNLLNTTFKKWKSKSILTLLQKSFKTKISSSDVTYIYNWENKYVIKYSEGCKDIQLKERIWRANKINQYRLDRKNLKDGDGKEIEVKNFLECPNKQLYEIKDSAVLKLIDNSGYSSLEQKCLLVCDKIVFDKEESDNFFNGYSRWKYDSQSNLSKLSIHQIILHDLFQLNLIQDWTSNCNCVLKKNENGQNKKLVILDTKDGDPDLKIVDYYDELESNPNLTPEQYIMKKP